MLGSKLAEDDDGSSATGVSFCWFVVEYGLAATDDRSRKGSWMPLRANRG